MYNFRSFLILPILIAVSVLTDCRLPVDNANSLIPKKAEAGKGYTALDLGTLGGSYSHASNISDLGDGISGESTTASGDKHAFLFSKGIMKDIGTLGGRGSTAYGVNNSRQVVGSSATGHRSWHAFLYSEGVMKDLGTLGGPTSHASDINDHGQVVGYSELSGNRGRHAFLYDKGVMADLNDLLPPGSGWELLNASGINNRGQIVGKGLIGGEWHAFFFSGETITDLGTLGGSDSSASDISNSGQVSGASDSGHGLFHAFLYSEGVMKDLGALGGLRSGAHSVNNAGQAVGYADLPGKGVRHAFLYSDGMMKDFNDLLPPGSGWELQNAYHINNRGQMVGVGLINGERHAFLLTPTHAVSASKPVRHVSSGLKVKAK